MPKKNVTTSIRKSMMLLMLSLTTVTIFVFVLLITMVRLLPSINDASYRSMYNQSAAQASRIRSELAGMTRSVWRAADELTEEMEALLLRNNQPLSKLGRDPALQEYLDESYEILSGILTEQSVSGAFVVLNTTYGGDGEEDLAALYLRNTLSASTTQPSASLTLLRGPARINVERNIALDKCWATAHKLGDGLAAQFYTYPVEAHQIYPKASMRDLGYWSTRFQLEPPDPTVPDIEITTYSVPLIGSNGEVYGVCGMELSLGAMARIAPSDDLPYEGGFYLFGHFIDKELIGDTVISNDNHAVNYIQDADNNLTARLVSEEHHIYALESVTGPGMLAAAVDIELYDWNSPFRDESYSLLVVAPRSQVLADSRQMISDILLTLAIAAVLSAVGAILLSRSFSRRIEHLAQEVRQMTHEKPTPLPRTHIKEVDMLSETLEQMNADIVAHAARMSTIVDSVGMPMGAFEISLRTGEVFLTDSLFRLLDLPHEETDAQYMSAEEFRKILPQIDMSMKEDKIDLCWVSASAKREERWLRLRRTINTDYLYGTVLDITDEVMQKARLEYERSYDPLTKLLNRNAYPETMESRIAQAPGRKGVMLFGDLDNLKHCNDTFGHETGDAYISAAADGLREFANEGGVVARVAGDEFAVYLHGFDSKEDLRRVVDKTLEGLRSKSIDTPDGNVQRLSMSIGLAYYPDDADNVPDLIRYADFAMYQIKHAVKGGTGEFDMRAYIDDNTLRM